MSDIFPAGTKELDLRGYTAARVSLRRSGVSLATSENLAFAEAHALARDAVHAALALPSLLAGLRGRGLEPVAVRSAAEDRRTYLRRPDLGRRLNDASLERLRGVAREADGEPDGGLTRLTVVLADGLSALAVERNALPLLDALLPRLPESFGLTAVVVAEQGRVGLGDAIGAALGSGMTLVLIGERPGLSSPDSLGAYLTWAPAVGRTDAERNCVSNIRVGGLGYEEAARRIAFLAGEAGRRRLTGTALKEGPAELAAGTAQLGGGDVRA